MMQQYNYDALALTTAINTLSTTIAEKLNDNDLAMLAVVLTQMGDTLTTISTQRGIQKSTLS